MQAYTIEEVITFLDKIISDCKAGSSRLGYFASLYRKMTLGVKEGIDKGLFEDGPRMEKLDVVFANRYLKAYDQYSKGQQPTASWKTAFDAVQKDELTVMQHLLLGMNAHINLDLGIAAAEVSTPDTIAALQADYNKINTIIASFFGAVQDCLSKIAFPMYFIKRIDPDTTTAVLNFSICKARETAWNNAILLVTAGPQALPEITRTTDMLVNTIAQRIHAPGTLMALLLKWIRWTEGRDISRNIGFLNE